MSPVGNGDTIFFNPGGVWSLTTEPVPVSAPITGYNIYRGEGGSLSRVATITPDSTHITPNSMRQIRSSNRNRYIEDNHGTCMCYKHRRVWYEGAEFKKGRRPRTGPGGACKECCLKAEI